MAGNSLADAISRLTMHRLAMQELAAQLAAEREQAGADPSPPPDHEPEEDKR